MRGRVITEKKPFRHFCVIDLSFDRSTFNTQRGDIGTRRGTSLLKAIELSAVELCSKKRVRHFPDLRVLDLDS